VAVAAVAITQQVEMAVLEEVAVVVVELLLVLELLVKEIMVLLGLVEMPAAAVVAQGQ
jgi:hypothetical protein